MKEMTFDDLQTFSETELPVCPNATKERKAQITKALSDLSESGLLLGDTKPFDSKLGNVADQFSANLNTHHLMAVCCAKMKQIFSQNAFVSL